MNVEYYVRCDKIPEKRDYREDARYRGTTFPSTIAIRLHRIQRAVREGQDPDVVEVKKQELRAVTQIALPSHHDWFFPPTQECHGIRSTLPLPAEEGTPAGRSGRPSTS